MAIITYQQIYLIEQINNLKDSKDKEDIEKVKAMRYEQKNLIEKLTGISQIHFLENL